MRTHISYKCAPFPPFFHSVPAVPRPPRKRYAAAARGRLTFSQSPFPSLPQLTPVSIPLGHGDTFTFQGTYDPVNIYSKEMENFYLGANNALKTPKSENYTLNAFRAYFHIGSSAQVKNFVLNFDGDTENTTSISPRQLLPKIGEGGREDAWTDLNGRRLAGKPTRKGLYIHQGKKLGVFK